MCHKNLFVCVLVSHFKLKTCCSNKFDVLWTTPIVATEIAVTLPRLNTALFFGNGNMNLPLSHCNGQLLALSVLKNQENEHSLLYYSVISDYQYFPKKVLDDDS